MDCTLGSDAPLPHHKSKVICIIKGIGRTDAKLSQNSLHFRPELFNRIQIRTVWRQIKDLCSSTTQQFTHRLDMVGPEIVHYHNIPWMESRDQNIFQISQEFISCCSTLKNRKGHFSIQSNGRQNGSGLRRVQPAPIPRMPTQLLLCRAFSHMLLPANSLLRYAASFSP